MASSPVAAAAPGLAASSLDLALTGTESDEEVSMIESFASASFSMHDHESARDRNLSILSTLLLNVLPLGYAAPANGAGRSASAKRFGTKERLARGRRPAKRHPDAAEAHCVYDDDEDASDDDQMMATSCYPTPSSSYSHPHHLQQQHMPPAYSSFDITFPSMSSSHALNHQHYTNSSSSHFISESGNSSPVGRRTTRTTKGFDTVISSSCLSSTSTPKPIPYQQQQHESYISYADEDAGYRPEQTSTMGAGRVPDNSRERAYLGTADGERSAYDNRDHASWYQEGEYGAFEVGTAGDAGSDHEMQ